MIQQITAFQSEGESTFRPEPLCRFYPQLNKAYVESLPFPERRAYFERTLRTVYAGLADTINETLSLYSAHWAIYKEQSTAALSDAFGVDCSKLFHALRCNVTMNPIMPRFLQEHSFDVFYLSSAKGAVGLALHELVHFVWFYVWNRLLGDSYDEYERPSLKSILSEMVVESVMKDERLSSINPYFPREHGGCVYSYFFDMEADGKLVLDTPDAMYRSQRIEDFMRDSYAYCRKYEAEIRKYIRKAEGEGRLDIRQVV